MYPWPEAAEETGKVRQASVQTPEPDRDNVWQAQGLAACGNPLRQVPEGLPVSNRPRRTRHLLVMSPDPNLYLLF